jgi:cell division protein ZapB
LTWKGFSNYSALMKEELKLLEEKINQFVQLCHHQRTENMQLREKLAEATSENKNLSEEINGATTRLGTENTQLREQLAEATSENKNLSEKISGATNRLEALLTQFPNSPIINND